MFDESFHLYCEEVDWALRIRKAGWKAICAPKSVVVHLGGQSSVQVRPQSIINLWTARLKLYRKYYNPLKLGIAVTIVRMGMNRLIQRAVRDSSQTDDVNKSLVDAYRRVLELCGQT
jgi:GT2 family glycosyltransferase